MMQLHVSSGGRHSVHEVPTILPGYASELTCVGYVWLKCCFWLAAFDAVCIAAQHMCHGRVHHSACQEWHRPQGKHPAHCGPHVLLVAGYERVQLPALWLMYH